MHCVDLYVSQNSDHDSSKLMSVLVEIFWHTVYVVNIVRNADEIDFVSHNTHLELTCRRHFRKLPGLFASRGAVPGNEIGHIVCDTVSYTG